MTLINRLIAEAKREPRPTELLVPRNRCRQVAEHARLINACHFYDFDTDWFETQLLAGKAKMLGIPLRVVGRLPGDG